MNKPTWFLLGSEQDYEIATARYEEIKRAPKGTIEHKEKMLLVHLISIYENEKWDLPDVDPVKLIKIRMQDLGYKSADLAKKYGDKGTVSKVLNYKQSLSLTMIRTFSDMLSIPPELLIKEYDLKGSQSLT
ncbi:XRE family transcriptional regulator [Pedobacter antarcticus 4BY]|uniref:XRE family transcriptional regulator n=2 Tax=Pedobacter antarcticus TaxID=34086 RepID=A0A081PKJ6_9SPHI|nr:XRE family transcriptional regulator [Pedobacter antarcticus]KEQ31219.1 XRE family transcriptional regulator [Pedobacter antarcticus 4BY]SFE55366.1 HTH-type transcriptional regulator / antitoxin HigA [Pedobacter antarcticus]